MTRRYFFTVASTDENRRIATRKTFDVAHHFAHVFFLEISADLFDLSGQRITVFSGKFGDRIFFAAFAQSSADLFEAVGDARQTARQLVLWSSSALVAFSVAST